MVVVDCHNHIAAVTLLILIPVRLAPKGLIIEVAKDPLFHYLHVLSRCIMIDDSLMLDASLVVAVKLVDQTCGINATISNSLYYCNVDENMEFSMSYAKNMDKFHI